jgi:hypothetical protein
MFRPVPELAVKLAPFCRNKLPLEARARVSMVIAPSVPISVTLLLPLTVAS